jgi:hypothetical protein
MLFSVLLLAACNEYELQNSDIAPVGFECDQPVEVAPADECEIEPSAGNFNPELEWHMADFPSSSPSNEVMMTPVVGHLTDDDGDGVYGSDGDIPDIAFVTYDDEGYWGHGVLRVISGDGSGEHWSDAADQALQGQGGVAIGDLEGDGIPDLVAVTQYNAVYAWDATGNRKWNSQEFGYGDVGSYCAGPAISDMDGDGIAEVIVGRVILDGSDGTELGRGQYGIGDGSGIGSTSFAVDIDLDGKQEVITGNAAYTKNGSLLYGGQGADGYVAVANFDNDPEGEVVVVNSSTIRLLNHDYSEIWSEPLGGGGPPTVGDFDGDGEPEIGVAGWAQYTVYETDGSILWSRTTQDNSSGVTGSSVFDFDGDGIAEVVYADEMSLWVFSGPDGSVRLQSPHHQSYTWLEYPVIVDVDADGAAEIVVPNNPFSDDQCRCPATAASPTTPPSPRH